MRTLSLENLTVTGHIERKRETSNLSKWTPEQGLGGGKNGHKYCWEIQKIKICGEPWSLRFWRNTTDEKKKRSLENINFIINNFPFVNQVVCLKKKTYLLLLYMYRYLFENWRVYFHDCLVYSRIMPFCWKNYFVMFRKLHKVSCLK